MLFEGIESGRSDAELVEYGCPVFEVLDEGFASLKLFGHDDGVAGVDVASSVLAFAEYGSVGEYPVDFAFVAGGVDASGHFQVVVGAFALLPDEGVLLIDGADDVNCCRAEGYIDMIAVIERQVGQVCDGCCFVAECVEDDAAFCPDLAELLGESALRVDFGLDCLYFGCFADGGEALFSACFEVFFEAVCHLVDFFLLRASDAFAADAGAENIALVGYAADSVDELFEGLPFPDFVNAFLGDFAVNDNEGAFGENFERRGSGGIDSDDVGWLQVERGEFVLYGVPVGVEFGDGLKSVVDVFFDDDLFEVGSGDESSGPAGEVGYGCFVVEFVYGRLFDVAKQRDKGSDGRDVDDVSILEGEVG